MIERSLGLPGTHEPHGIPKSGHTWVLAVRWMVPGQEDTRSASVTASTGKQVVPAMSAAGKRYVSQELVVTQGKGATVK